MVRSRRSRATTAIAVVAALAVIASACGSSAKKGGSNTNTGPTTTLGVVGAAGTARFQRAAMLEVASQDYVRTARAKGVPERQIVLRHQLRNALLSFITRFGLAFPFLLTGAVLVETVFAWPGMGRLAFNAILTRDYPLVTASALIASTVVLAGNLLADILLGIADPRLRVHAGADVDIATV